MIITAKLITFLNDVGGTGELKGRFRVRVIKRKHDHETGTIFQGELVDAQDIELVRKKGVTGYNPEDYSKYSQDLAMETQQAREAFDPTKVWVNSCMCEW